MVVTGQTLNIFSQIGLIMLIGMVAKNGILIVEFANQRQQAGLSIMDAAREAAVARFRPVLMTSLTTILGILPLALATGDCWQGLLDTIPGFIPVAGNHIVHIGGRDIDPKESARFSRGGATLVDSKSLQAIGIYQGLEAAFQSLSHHTDRVYVHLDMDIVDPVVARSKDFAPTGGLTVEQVVQALHMIQEYFNIRAGTIAACDPDSDEEGRAIKAGLTFAQVLVPEGGLRRC